MERTQLARRMAVAGALLSTLLSGSALASDLIKLSTRVLQEQQITGADGHARLQPVPARNILPGSELIYEVSYANVGDRPAAELFITNPLPAELRYRAALPSAAATRFEVSVDQGRSFGELKSLRVRGTDGTLRPAQAADITHVRWHVKRAVQPGEAGKVALKAVLH